jgi:EAL domain-containing protein (putative c-di-GMP-specific phosphodiesterase class I)
LVDVEGLLRWRHPGHGLLAPGDFLELVEGIGHRSSMDRLVFDEAAALAARLQSLNVGVSVNVSAGSLLRSSVPGVLDDALRRHDVVAQRITVEVIEDEMVDERSTARAVLGALGELGVGIAIDDFGTGHSSLARLRRLPVTSLKIDQSFVSSMLRSEDDSAILSDVSHLGRALDLLVVAEGVEDLAVRAHMLEHDLPIDRLQGYGIARPMPVEDLFAWIGARESVTA